MARGQAGKSKRGGGQPTKFSKRVAARYLKAISKGLPKRRAALCTGVSYATLRLWAVKGENLGSGELYEFFISLKKSEALAEEARCATIVNASKKNWTAAAWWLERKYPERWGRRDAVAVNGKIQQNVNAKIGVSQLPSKEELLQFMKEHSDMLPDVIETTAKKLNGESNGQH